MDTAKYFQNGLAEIIEIRHTVRSVDIISFDIFFEFSEIIYFEDTNRIHFNKKKNKKFKRKIHKFYATKDFQNGGDVGVCYNTEFTKNFLFKNIKFAIKKKIKLTLYLQNK
jgi:hypothetical protein